MSAFSSFCVAVMLIWGAFPPPLPPFKISCRLTSASLPNRAEVCSHPSTDGHSRRCDNGVTDDPHTTAGYGHVVPLPAREDERPRHRRPSVTANQPNRIPRCCCSRRPRCPTPSIHTSTVESTCDKRQINSRQRKVRNRPPLTCGSCDRSSRSRRCFFYRGGRHVAIVAIFQTQTVAGLWLRIKL